jgi:hypothetical protein
MLLTVRRQSLRLHACETNFETKELDELLPQISSTPIAAPQVAIDPKLG